MKQKNRCLWIAAATLLAMALTCGIVGCDASGPVRQPTEPDSVGITTGQTHSEMEGLGVQITDVIRDDAGTTLEVQWSNHTAYDAVYGASYVIEREEDGRWISCAKEDNLAFIDITCELPAGKEQRDTYPLARTYDISAPGKYRFRSECYVYTGEEKSEKCTLIAEFTVDSESNRETIPAPTALEYGVHYIRTNGYQDGAEFPRVEIIRSVEELNSYYEANKETFDLERKDKVYSDTTIGFLDACDKYDSAYFEKGYLVFVLLEEGSGSIRHEVTETTINSDGELGIYITRDVPEIGTADMAQWHIILELSDPVNVKDESDVLVYLDGKLALDAGGNIVKPTCCEEEVIYREPPGTILWYDGGNTALKLAGCSWICIAEDGTMSGMIADHAHPLDCKELLNPILPRNTYAKLEFEEEPDSVEVHCWPDSAWGQTGTESEPVTAYGAAMDLKPGGFIYEVTATWDDDGAGYYGSASYYFYAVVSV